MKDIYLAGGCFWGMEKLFSETDGVINAESGYANGRADIENPSYEDVCTGMTGYHETVHVEYDPALISLERLLLIYFNVIDPTVIAQQGVDRGTQYQTGIFFTDESDLPVIERLSKIVKDAAGIFCVEIEPFKNYFPAEEYHQKYLDKNPHGYCHIPRADLKDLPKMSTDALKERLLGRRYF